MISVQECRQYLGNLQLSDEQVELIRNFLYRLVQTKIDKYARA